MYLIPILAGYHRHTVDGKIFVQLVKGCGDVVVIHREDLGRDIIKRIVALPGDTVQITEGILYINGTPQPTPDGFSRMEDAGNAAAPITLRPGEYFVLGDNRSQSIDSRFDEVGIIYAPTITGKVIFPNVSSDSTSLFLFSSIPRLLSIFFAFLQ